MTESFWVVWERMREQTIQSLIYLLWGGDSSYRMENRWVRPRGDAVFIGAFRDAAVCCWGGCISQ